MSKREQNNQVISPIVTPDDVMKLLDALYSKAVDGLGKVSPPIEQFAFDYVSKSADVKEAAKKMIKAQIAKCTTSGIVTGFGGLITLPIAIPANISSVMYVQMRMIACLAYMAGYDLKSDQVQALVYACLAGIGVAQIAKKFSIDFGKRIAIAAIKKIPGEVITKINQRIGFRLLTKFGEKGLVNLGKMIPLVGAVINGGFDFVETKVIADRAYNLFFLGNTDDCDEVFIIGEDGITEIDTDNEPTVEESQP